MDCMEGMKDFPDKYFDLAIVDPPYGIGNFTEKWKGEVNWNNEIPNEEYFIEIFRISKNQIICGGNYYTKYLNHTKAWIIWDKQVSTKTGHVECEMFWTSLKFPTYILRETWTSGWYIQNQENIVHPCQKPKKLYKKLLISHATPEMKIIDTHVGSGSSIIAFLDFGCDWIGFEIDEDYHKAATERIERHKQQLKLF